MGGCSVKVEGNRWIWNYSELFTEDYK